MKLLCVLLIAMLLAQQVSPAYTFVLDHPAKKALGLAAVGIFAPAALVAPAFYAFFPAEDPPPEASLRAAVEVVAPSPPVDNVSKAHPTATPAPEAQVSRELVAVAKKDNTKYWAEEAHLRQTIKDGQKQARYYRALAHIQVHGIDLAPRHAPSVLLLQQAVRITDVFITAYNRQVVPFEDHLARFRVCYHEAIATLPFRVPNQLDRFSLRRIAPSTGGEVVPFLDHLARFRILAIASTGGLGHLMCPRPFNRTIDSAVQQSLAQDKDSLLIVAPPIEDESGSTYDETDLWLGFYAIALLALVLIVSASIYHLRKALESRRARLAFEQARMERRARMARRKRMRKCE